MENLYMLLADLHRPCERQGPGSVETSKLAVRLAGLERAKGLKIADIGCGTGASALLLAEELSAEVTAVDFLPVFLEELQQRAQARGLADRIRPLACSMTALPFADNEFDVLWAEGSVYNMGFENGVRAWRRFLKPGGMLVLSEITWLSAAVPAEIRAYWEKEYPEIATASAKMAQLERHGYRPVAYFALPENCWRDNYYAPLRERFPAFLAAQGHSDGARDIVVMEEREMALYEKFHQFYGYGMYIAQKCA